MAVTGRPSKLSPELTGKITDMLRAGNYLETAAAYAGIDQSTLHRWMKRGAREMERVEKSDRTLRIKKSEAPYVDFCKAIKKALAEAEVRDLIIISNAAKNDWKAAAWKLERRFPDKFGRKERINAQLEHSGKDGGPIQTEQSINLANLNDEELAFLESIVEKSSESG
ncbi:MAG: hypothetical protein ACI35R_10930 [Bacillus sp. (in: firmicutes)]